MKLIFKKDEGSHIQVFQEIEKEQKEFSYEDMIKNLIQCKKLENPEISNDFSDNETKSIMSMIQHINNEIADEVNETDKIEVKEGNDSNE